MFKTNLCILIFLLSCSKTEINESTINKSDINELVNFMIGSFSNKNQIASKYSFTIQNITDLKIAVSTDRWILERQSLSINPDEVFRQRIYRIALTDEGLIKADIYFLPENNLKSSIEVVNNLDKDSFLLREGCSIFFRKEDRKYIGATYGDECENSYQNATHIVEEFEISRYEFKTWVIGYDAEGNRVWGSAKTALVYNRISKK